MLDPDRFFDPDPAQRRVARQLYDGIAGLPIVSPHGHVNPQLLADENATFGTPADLFIIPDHYVFRMLYSQGIPLESLGVPRIDGGEVEADHRKIWQTFAEHFYLFRGTPTGIWLNHELAEVFGIERKLTGETAIDIYDELCDRLAQPEYRPRALFERFNIEVLATTDAASDPLTQHVAIRESGWTGRVIPTFRPDAVVNLDMPNWKQHVDALSKATNIEVSSYRLLIQALENRRAFFKQMGATATDHAAETAYTAQLSEQEASALFERGLRGEATKDDARRFTGHMMMEMARMSIEDGLVMQFHTGSIRSTNPAIASAFGRDKGDDIPTTGEFTHNLRPLLNEYGNDPRFSLVLFTLDETTYSRELAPLAGHYPAVWLGPPWWFHDSLNGLRRYFDLVMETAGLYNTAGFNDDTRAFASIPARHDLWRRAAADWLAGLVVRGIVDESDAAEMATDMAYGLAKRAYKIG
jgi:glucuronate isomerase